MPFQPINFASIQPQGAPVFKDLIQTLMQGYQAGQMPFQMRRQAETEDITNALTRQKIQQAQRDSAKHDIIMGLMSGKSSQANPQMDQQPSIMQMFGGNQTQPSMAPLVGAKQQDQQSDQPAWVANFQKQIEALSPDEKKALYRKEWGIDKPLPEEEDARKLKLFIQEKDYDRKHGSPHELQGPARQVYDLQQLEKQFPKINGHDSPQVKLAKQIFQTSMNRGMGSTGIRQEANVISNVAKDNPNLTTDEQIREATDRIAGGFDTLENGTPITVGNITKEALNQWKKSGTTTTQLNNMISGQQAEEEINITNKYRDKALGYYGDTLGKWSPAMSADTLKAKAGDAQAENRLADKIVADVLVLEGAQLQERLATGKVTVSGRKELLERAEKKAGGNFNILTSRTQQLANDRLANALKEMFVARKKVGTGAFTATTGYKNETNNESPSSTGNEPDFIYDPSHKLIPNPKKRSK